MASWQMTAVATAIRLTRGRRLRTEAGGRRLIAQPKGSPVPPLSVSSRCTVRRTEVNGFAVYVIRSTAAVGTVGGDRDRDSGGDGDAGGSPAVVYLHGGAYVNEIVGQHWALIADLADETQCDVHVPIYGLAPQHHALTGLETVTAVVEGIGRQGRAVHLVGDSAGAGLALLTAQATVREQWVASVTVMAPWLDLSMSNPAIAEVERTDPWLNRAGLRPVAAAWAGDLELTDPRVSPLYGDLTGLPPVTTWVGTRDITLPDCRLLHQRLTGGPMGGYHEEPGAIHVYPLLPVPEGRSARRALLADVTARVTAHS